MLYLHYISVIERCEKVISYSFISTETALLSFWVSSVFLLSSTSSCVHDWKTSFILEVHTGITNADNNIRGLIHRKTFSAKCVLHNMTSSCQWICSSCVNIKLSNIIFCVWNNSFSRFYIYFSTVSIDLFLYTKNKFQVINQIHTLNLKRRRRILTYV